MWRMSGARLKKALDLTQEKDGPLSGEHVEQEKSKGNEYP